MSKSFAYLLVEYYYILAFWMFFCVARCNDDGQEDWRICFDRNDEVDVMTILKNPKKDGAKECIKVSGFLVHNMTAIIFTK